MPMIRQNSFEDIMARGIIKDTDVLALRRKYYEEGRLAVEEAEKFFALDAGCPVQDASWPACFCEIITDFVVNQSVPQGYVTIENAEWLLQRISKRGRIGSKTHLELLINVIDQARWSPEPLGVFALEQVAMAIKDGLGPVRDRATDAQAGAVSASDVELLRRILYAAGGDASSAISRAEAEVLSAINDMTATAANAPDWSDLYVKAMGNHVLAGSGYAVPSREEALARDQWLDQSAATKAGNSTARSPFAGYRKNDLEAELQKLERIRTSIVTNADVTGPDLMWLVERFKSNVQLTENEQNLLDVLASENMVLNADLIESIGGHQRAA